MRVASSMLMLAAVMVLPVGARAAEADTMSVTGRITDQSGCTISLSNGGAVEYGLITAASLSQSSETFLPAKTLSANIVCTAPTYMAMTIDDLRTNSLTDSQFDRFGLGITRTGNPIGRYTVQNQADQLPRPIVDGVSRRFGQRDQAPSGAAGWGNIGGNDFWPKRWYRTFVDDANIAVQVSTAQFVVELRARVQSRDALQLQGAERIDGQFVLDIYYM